MLEEPGRQLEIVRCQRCGSPAGLRSEDAAAYRAGQIQVWCSGCEEEYRRLTDDVMLILDQHAGLTKEHRDALAHLAELALNDPEKALTVQSLNQRVDNLRSLLGVLIAVFGLILTALGVLVGILVL